MKICLACFSGSAVKQEVDVLNEQELVSFRRVTSVKFENQKEKPCDDHDGDNNNNNNTTYVQWSPWILQTYIFQQASAWKY